ncbi:ubiquitin-associated and SH3 domain-containing protein A-like [Macrobrachium rosenbergii]|uniref:ubiquitin-associated and SH3 domain-containing protein A-like n=1 Tax=Macrobrachium rosenbergii TaxID=79674 RepID=UPI0034D70390
MWHGQDDAQNLGSIMTNAHNITSIYVSPVYRCMEAARKIEEGASLHNIKMKIDPGLLEWAATFGEVLSLEELLRAGFNISQESEPLMEATDINVRETMKDYCIRSQRTFTHCLEDHRQTAREGTMLVVAHQMTMLKIPIDSAKERIPFFLELVQLGAKLPYLGHVWLSKDGNI